jgi:beta-N-acetylhexosaminidase
MDVTGAHRVRAALVLLVATLTVAACHAGSSAPPNRASSAPAPSAAPPSGDSPAASGPDACVSATLATLDLPGRVGQVLMVGTPIANPAGLADTVRRYRLGGVFLAGRTTASAATLRQGIHTLQSAAAIPLQIAVDQEGGEVQTLQGNDFPPIPTAVAQGRWDTATLRSHTGDWAKRLAGAGITLDLAPVADTVAADLGKANPPIGAYDRQYGATPDAVAQDIGTVVGAVQGAGVLTTLKHFPGLGRVRANTDTSDRAVDSVSTVDDPNLKPFAAGIQAGSAAVMVSLASYPHLDAKAIAAFSAPVVTGLLRQRLGYTGLVLSDDLGAAAAVQAVPTGQRAVRFIEAGGDLALTIRPADAAVMSSALLSAAQASPAFAARVTDAATHVLRSKQRAGLLKCPSS